MEFSAKARRTRKGCEDHERREKSENAIFLFAGYIVDHMVSWTLFTQKWINCYHTLFHEVSNSHRPWVPLPGYYAVNAAELCTKHTWSNYTIVDTYIWFDGWLKEMLVHCINGTFIVWLFPFRLKSHIFVTARGRKRKRASERKWHIYKTMALFWDY